MSSISFYHLTASPLEKALPRLMEKVVESGMRAIIRTPDEARAEMLTEVMWTYSTKTFVPHGNKKDGNISRQPIYLTADNDNPNGATLLVLVDGLDGTDIDQFERCLFFFDSADEIQMKKAREYWKKYKQAGHELIYWQQTPQGGWDKKAMGN